jgi:hypothetical protein
MPAPSPAGLPQEMRRVLEIDAKGQSPGRGRSLQQPGGRNRRARPRRAARLLECVLRTAIRDFPFVPRNVSSKSGEPASAFNSHVWSQQKMAKKSGAKNLRDQDVRIDDFFAPVFFALTELWLRLTAREKTS